VGEKVGRFRFENKPKTNLLRRGHFVTVTIVSPVLFIFVDSYLV
jgi:hypothetical protein